MMHNFQAALDGVVNIQGSLKTILAEFRNLAVLFALYPRFYFIKSVYVNNEYRFLNTVVHHAPPIVSAKNRNTQASSAAVSCCVPLPVCPPLAGA